MVKHLKKMGGGGNGPVYPEGGSISVPLEECPICIDNDLEVPYLVKVRFLFPSINCMHVCMFVHAKRPNKRPCKADQAIFLRKQMHTKFT